MLEVAVVNAYILYKVLVVSRGQKPMNHHAFRRHLIESLAEPIRNSVIPWARSGPNMAQSINVQSGTFLRWERRGRTAWCAATVSRVVHDISHTMSGTCPEKPSLCPAGCFEAYHTHKQYRHCSFSSVTNVCQFYNGFILCIHPALYPTLISCYVLI